jgi:hypothetical protein
MKLWSHEVRHVAQLDSEKCQGLVGTLGIKFRKQGDTWKPLSQCHVNSDINNHVTLGYLNSSKHSSPESQISEIISCLRLVKGIGTVDLRVKQYSTLWLS